MHVYKWQIRRVQATGVSVEILTLFDIQQLELYLNEIIIANIIEFKS